MLFRGCYPLIDPDGHGVLGQTLDIHKTVCLLFAHQSITVWNNADAATKDFGRTKLQTLTMLLIIAATLALISNKK